MPNTTGTNARWFFLNLFLLIAVGVATLLWVLLYTEYFEIVGGLLGLGGAFAWIAFVSNILTEERKKELQRNFDELLQRPILLLAIIFAALIFSFLLPFRTGTIIIDSFRDETYRVARIAPNDKDEIPLTPRGQLKVVVGSGLFSHEEHRVKLSGLPAIRISVGTLRRNRLVVPTSFYHRPLLLIRPMPLDSSNLSTMPGVSVTVFCNGHESGMLKDYKGQAFWIQADDDVLVPPEIQQRWRRKLAVEVKDPEGQDAAIMRWLPVRGVADTSVGGVIDCKNGDTVRIVVQRQGDGQGKLKILDFSTSVLSEGAPYFVQDIQLSKLDFSATKSNP